MLLFYFENKIMDEFNKKKMEEKNYFENSNIWKCFENCLNSLEKEYFNNNKKNYLWV